MGRFFNPAQVQVAGDAFAQGDGGARECTGGSGRLSIRSMWGKQAGFFFQQDQPKIVGIQRLADQASGGFDQAVFVARLRASPARASAAPTWNAISGCCGAIT